MTELHPSCSSNTSTASPYSTCVSIRLSSVNDSFSSKLSSNNHRWISAGYIIPSRSISRALSVSLQIVPTFTLQYLIIHSPSYVKLFYPFLIHNLLAPSLSNHYKLDHLLLHD